MTASKTRANGFDATPLPSRSQKDPTPPRHSTSQVKQEMNETLRSSLRCFLKIRTTIANITDEDVIHCFQNGLFLKHTYHEFRCNRLTTAVELRYMMAWWAA
jgi:hypothetical protein